MRLTRRNSRPGMLATTVLVAGQILVLFAPNSAASDPEERAASCSDSCERCCELESIGDPRCESGRMASQLVASIWTDEAGIKFACLNGSTNGTGTANGEEDTAYSQELPRNESLNYHLCNGTCIRILPDGSLVLGQIMENLTSSVNMTDMGNMMINDTDLTNVEQCDSLLTPLKFWGATIVIFANLIYIFPYLFVVIVYMAIPALRHRAYDGAVISYNVSQVLTQVIQIAMGAELLCHVPINPIFFAPAGLSLMFLTISSTFWLFVICFDMTLVITRFRWAPPGDASRKQEIRKFWMYAAWVWGGTFVPTLFACIMEYSLEKDSLIRPKFDTFYEGPVVTVILYVAAVPALVCIVNSFLFFYTTYRMIVMQRETTIATQSSTKNAKKKYFVYLKLYLLMDTPWLTGALGAIFPNLWILKFCRMSQPILMLIVILPKKVLADTFKCKRDAPVANGATAEQDKKSKRCPRLCC